MTIRKCVGQYGTDYVGKDTDLVTGFPPMLVTYNVGDTMTIYNAATNELEIIFQVVDVGDGGIWMKLL